MNNTDNTGNTNPSVNQPSSSPFVTPAPVGFDAQQNSAQSVAQPVTPQPVQSVPVTPAPAPTPMPAQPQAPVTPTPMPAQPAPVSPTPMATTAEDPNAKIAEVNIPPANVTAAEEPQVINTKKSRGSNILLFIVIAILIFFAINIDKMAEMYDNYMKTGSLTATNVTPDNTTDGFIRIDETTSSMKVDSINFYNFRKNVSSMTVSFNYEAFETYEEPANLGIYIEIYNSSKQLLSKELFDTKNKIDKNTTSNYTLTLDSDVFESAFYALVKKYNAEEAASNTSLTCKYNDEKYNYETKYNFVNNSLDTYDITKVSLSEEEDSTLKAEYESLFGKVTVSFKDNTLKYSIDLNNDIQGYNPLYKKGLTPLIVKNREELKKWTCE